MIHFFKRFFFNYVHFAKKNNLYNKSWELQVATNEWKDPPFTYFGEAMDLIQKALALPKIF